ncbi:MAG: cation efflux family transporter, partial [Gammaproteobacteria bacterium]
DAVGSICIGVVLIAVSIFVAWRIKALILGSSAEPDVRNQINQMIRQNESIEKLFNVITIQFRAKIMLAAKNKLPDTMSIKESVKSVNLLEKNIKQQLPNIDWCFIEPDDKD